MIRFYKTFDFLYILLENRIVSSFFPELTNTIAQNKVDLPKSTFPLDPSQYVYTVYNVPDYLKIHLDQHQNIKVKHIPTFKGSMIRLTDYADLGQYLSSKFSSDRRSKFRTYKKRLLNAFDVEFKTYYGSIEKDTYDYIFQEFLHMIQKRFKEKRTTHDDLHRWNHYVKIGYPLIVNKEACLFVIYANGKPISISFNPIIDRIIYGYIRAFDTDYAKFYPGFIDLLYQLEWCFSHGFKIFDLLLGSYEYKSKWIDHEYTFQKVVLYNSKALLINFMGNLKVVRLKIFHSLYRSLKNLKLDEIKNKVGFAIKSRFKPVRTKNYAIHHLDYPGDIKPENLEPTDVQFHDFLRKPVYDFLYTRKESLKNVEVSKILDQTDTFLLKGTNHTIKIVFTQR